MSNLDTLESELLTAIDGADDEATLEDVRVQALGKRARFPSK